MRHLTALILAAALLGCSGFRLSPAQRAAFQRAYVIQQQQRTYRQPPVQYRAPAMVLPAYRPYQPPRQLYCTPAYDGMGGQVCR